MDSRDQARVLRHHNTRLHKPKHQSNTYIFREPPDRPWNFRRAVRQYAAPATAFGFVAPRRAAVRSIFLNVVGSMMAPRGCFRRHARRDPDILAIYVT